MPPSRAQLGRRSDVSREVEANFNDQRQGLKQLLTQPLWVGRANPARRSTASGGMLFETKTEVWSGETSSSWRGRRQRRPRCENNGLLRKELTVDIVAELQRMLKKETSRILPRYAKLRDELAVVLQKYAPQFAAAFGDDDEDEVVLFTSRKIAEALGITSDDSGCSDEVLALLDAKGSEMPRTPNARC